MSILGFNTSSSHENNNNNTMLSQKNRPLFHEFKKQASFYIKEKIKTARLALTDVTPVQLLTEEATNGNPWAPDAKTMGLISRAAFEVDDYWRVVEILHTRLASFDKKNWRGSYNALLVLEHLLTHGPESVAKEFQDDKSLITQMQFFHHVDEKGFNWGLTVRKKSERILELLNNTSLLKEERNRARKVTRGIQGFGSFSSKQSVLRESKSDSHEILRRSHTQFNEHCNEENDDNVLPLTNEIQGKRKGNSTNNAVENPPLVNSTRKENAKENMAPLSSYRVREEFHEWSNLEGGEMNSLLIGGTSNVVEEEDHHQQHPFNSNEKLTKSCLLGGCKED